MATTYEVNYNNVVYNVTIEPKRIFIQNQGWRSREDIVFDAEEFTTRLHQTIPNFSAVADRPMVIKSGNGNDTITGSINVWSDANGLNGVDNINSVAFDGRREIHLRAGGSNDTIKLNFSNLTQNSTGHHVWGDHERFGKNSSDVIDIVNIKNINEFVVVGRLDDYDHNRDTLKLEGVELDLTNTSSLPSNVKVVAFNGSHDNQNAAPQRWLVIKNQDGGILFYALDGARINVTGEYDNVYYQDEEHFMRFEFLQEKATEAGYSDLREFLWNLPEMEYEDLHNFLPVELPEGWNKNGVTYWDFDDNRADQNAIIDKGLRASETFEKNDLISAGLNADTVKAGTGDDLVYGGDGNDTLYGEAGNDMIFGDRENDTLHGDAGNDMLDGGDGIDTLHGEDGNDMLKGGDDNDTLHGDAGNDALYGGNGIDTLYGGDGNDSFFGNTTRDRSHSDKIYGGNGTDTISYSTSTFGIRVDLRRTAQSNGEQLNSIENIEGTAYNDHLVGENSANMIFGENGNDNIWGLNGNDLIYAGAGNDRLAGGNDNDSMRGDDGNDLLYGQNGNDVLDGGNHNDKVYGGNGNDILYGQNGRDTLVAGAGNDRLYGGNDNDRMRGDDGNDLLYGQNGNDRLDGGNHNDKVYGGDGNDILYGQNGNDRLDGGNHNDKVYGGNGNDLLYGQNGNDLLYGGNHNDRVYGGDGNDLLYGQNGNDSLNGGVGDDRLLGGIGNDTLFGYHNNDTLNGDDGADRLYGQNGNDRLDGGRGDDTLYGGNHNDILAGKAGNDTLYGGKGDDVFYFTGRDNVDRIYDLQKGTGNSGHDIIRIAGNIINNYAQVQNAMTQVGSAVEIDFGAGHKLYLNNTQISELNADMFDFV